MSAAFFHIDENLGDDLDAFFKSLSDILTVREMDLSEFHEMTSGFIDAMHPENTITIDGIRSWLSDIRMASAVNCGEATQSIVAASPKGVVVIFWSLVVDP